MSTFYQVSIIQGSVHSFHEELKQILELEDLSEEVSVRLIQEYARRGIFTVGNMIKYEK